MNRHRSRIRRLESRRASQARGNDATRVDIPCDPVAFARQLNIDPDPWQRDLLMSTDNHVILNCARQSGKSTIVAVLALHHALRNPEALVLVLSPSLRQSGELFKKIVNFYKDLGKPIPSETETALTLQLVNKRRIVSLPGKEQTVRGYSGVSLLVIDEAAKVNDDLYYSVRPMLAVSRGRLILLSTPFGKRGFFWRAWSESSPWKKVKIRADQCPRISSSFLREERAALGEWWYAQEYLCEFSENVDQYFSYNEIHSAVTEDVKPLFGPDGRLSLEPQSHKGKRSSFYMGVDLGQSQDYTAIAIIEHVAYDREHKYHVRHCERLPLGTSYQDITRHIKTFVRQFENEGRGITLVVDATGVGKPVIDSLKEDGLKPVPITVTSGQNASFSDGEWHVPKRDIVASAKVALGKRQLNIAKGIPLVDTLLHELEIFRVKRNIATGHDTYEAWGEGEHDDLVFALSLAVWWALQKKKASPFFDHRDEIMGHTSEGAINPQDHYRIGWVPALNEEYGALVVYNVDRSSVVLLQRTKHESIRQQIDAIFLVAQRYDAVVRGQAEIDEAVLRVLIQMGAPVRRVDMTPPKFSQAYQNLFLLISYEQIKLPNDPELLVELEVGQNSAVRALCLVTYDIHPEIKAKAYYLDEDGGGVHSWLRGVNDGPFNYDDEYDDDDDSGY